MMFGLMQLPPRFAAPTIPPVEEELRESGRFALNLLMRPQGESRFTWRRANMGIGGFCVMTDMSSQAGSPVEIRFRLPTRPGWIHASGTILAPIRWRGRESVRCRFEKIDFGDMRMLARWLDWLNRPRNN
jgi:hypothetical protein